MQLQASSQSLNAVESKWSEERLILLSRSTSSCHPAFCTKVREGHGGRPHHTHNDPLHPGATATSLPLAHLQRQRSPALLTRQQPPRQPTPRCPTRGTGTPLPLNYMLSSHGAPLFSWALASIQGCPILGPSSKWGLPSARQNHNLRWRILALCAF